jgi:cytochrome c biogenesis protein CcdA
LLLFRMRCDWDAAKAQLWQNIMKSFLWQETSRAPCKPLTLAATSQKLDWQAIFVNNDCVRYCITAMLLTVALVMALSPALADGNSQIPAVTPPTCSSENALQALTVSSAATVFAAGLLAGFNPCLLAILAFLASSMRSSAGRRRDILTMVAFFSLGMFVVYIIFGVGLFSVLQDKSTSSMFRFVLAATLLVLGIMQLEDARRLQRKGTSLFRTDWTKKYVSSVIASRRPSLYFLLGALFSLVRAPCVGGIYIAIIGMISCQGFASSGITYLLIYNLGIALPVLLMGGIIALGMSPEQVDHFRNKHRVAIRLITGITLLVLALLIYWQMI